MKIPEREQDSLDFSSVTLSLLSDGGGKSIDDFRDVEDGQRVLVEVKSVAKVGAQDADLDNDNPDAATRDQTPMIQKKPFNAGIKQQQQIK